MGIGNPILCDDAVGIEAARLVYSRVQSDDIDFIEASVGGIALVEMLQGYDRALIIDAIETNGGRAGDLYRIELNNYRVLRDSGLSHSVGLLEGLELGKMLDMKLPDRLDIYAIEVQDVCTFSTEMTRAVTEALPTIVDEIIREEFSLQG